jgi:His-Xaa-Ser system protein HxsD
VSSEPEGIQFGLGSEDSAQIILDKCFYNKDAILKACYWYTDIAFIHVPESPAGKFVVSIKLKHNSPTLENPKPISIEELVGEFCNSLLDFELRRQVEAETAPVRQLILAKAFSESGVLEEDPPGSVADPVAKSNPGPLVKIMNSYQE